MQPITLLQYFHWYLPNDGTLWHQLKEQAAHLKTIGINAVWLPPAYKGASGGYSVGYDVYDLFDLGEFDQKGSVRTKYGTRQQYIDAVKACNENGIAAIADVVLNHKAGADELEKFTVKKVNAANRNEFISDAFDIEAWTKFTFPGRAGKYSDFIWDHRCFTGIDYAQDLDESGVFTIQNEYGEGWENLTTNELGNYDYLMHADVEYRNEAVRNEVKYWGEWYLETTGVRGFRLDAVKHMSPEIINEFTDHLQSKQTDPLFIVAEYWNVHQPQEILDYVNATEGRVQVFDAPLQQNFFVASQLGNKFDLRTIFDHSLVNTIPEKSVTLVGNHDTQQLQELEAPVEHWFKPLAYALILLRQSGIPCIFYPDLYGANYTDKGDDGNDHEIWLEKVPALEKMIQLRAAQANTIQHDYFDHPNCIGWVREGIAVLLSNGAEGTKRMSLGEFHAGKKMNDALGFLTNTITLDETGAADFNCPAGGVSVWELEAMA
jgi:alpha-amylase